MATYRYLFADLLSGALIEELPVNCDRFSSGLNGVGALSCTLDLTDLGGVDAAGATVPDHTAVYVERDERTLVWGGIVTKRRPINNGRGASIEAATFESYLGRRSIKSDWSFVGDDMFNVVRTFLYLLPTQTNGDLRITVDPDIMSGQSYTGAWVGKERANMLAEITKLAAQPPGFEFTIVVDRDTNGVFTHQMVLAAPHMSATIDPIVLEYPSGSVSLYDYPEDRTGAPNALTGIGQGEGAAMLLYEVVDDDDLAAGFPIFEGVFSAKDEVSFDRLVIRTAEVQRAGLGESTVPTVTLFGDASPAFGEYPLGVPARLRITSPYHPATVSGGPGIDEMRRVTGWSVVPGQAGRAEQVTLALGQAAT
ncbi:MAG TPA: hypothetical protein VK453_25425 [Micromonosporaceae bacterium]|nr:hypothetical protein [Micromonosporaceae bacterium]